MVTPSKCIYDRHDIIRPVLLALWHQPVTLLALAEAGRIDVATLRRWAKAAGLPRRKIPPPTQQKPALLL